MVINKLSVIVKEFFGYNKRTTVRGNDRIHISVRGEAFYGQSLRDESVRSEPLRGQSVLVGNIS